MQNSRGRERRLGTIEHIEGRAAVIGTVDVSKSLERYQHQCSYLITMMRMSQTAKTSCCAVSA